MVDQVMHDTHFGVSPTHAKTKKENSMDSGKIFLGIALVVFSAAMVINPAGAAEGDQLCPTVCGDLPAAGCGSAASLSQDPGYIAHPALPSITGISPKNQP